MAKFDLSMYDSMHVMHCPTQESAEIFTRFLDENGKCWCSGESYIESDNYHEYGADTGYCFHQGRFGDLDFYSSHGYTVLSFYDFDWDELKPCVPEMSFDECFYGIMPSN